ncbi:protein phosphatase 2C domain-containing protein [Streptomyces sp. NPDC057445]|uniref:protein phosphatase 2C domain-containing protein n=1 Tax=Streptomyces sp. NPDC057445 TaxID=3346136 RepID=UPI0036B478C7
MSQQGERPASADDWWQRLYDDSVPDTGPAPSTGDTVDDRFDSAVDTVGTASAHPHAPPVPPPAPAAPPAPPATPRVPEDRPRAWWDPLVPGARAPWERTAPPAPTTPPERPGAGATGAAGGPSVPAVPPRPQAAPDGPAQDAPVPPPRHGPPPRPRPGHVGDRPPTYDAEPTALPAADPHELGELVADTVLDGARYGTYTLRAASVRGDSARYRGEPRRDALLTARFGAGEGALLLVAVATGARATEGAHRAAADATRWIGGDVGRSHARLAEDIRAGRRGDLKSGLHRLTDRTLGKLRARAVELGSAPEEYGASLRCLLLSADPACRTRVFFGVGDGGLFRLRDGVWQDIEPPAPLGTTGEPVVGYGSPPSETPGGDRLTMDLGVPTPPSPHVDAPVPPPAEPFRFRASVARPGDTLLLCSAGLAEPLRGEPALAAELAGRWAAQEPPGLAAYLADTQLRVKGYADDRTACAVWEA